SHGVVLVPPDLLAARAVHETRGDAQVAVLPQHTSLEPEAHAVRVAELSALDVAAEPRPHVPITAQLEGELLRDPDGGHLRGRVRSGLERIHEDGRPVVGMDGRVLRRGRLRRRSRRLAAHADAEDGHVAAAWQLDAERLLLAREE